MVVGGRGHVTEMLIQLGRGGGAGLLPTPQSIVTLSMRIEIGTDDGYHLAVISAEHIQ